ncbi:hypothetical protein RNJ44_04953 [Nakaseomyces bracarensis]|uniref:Uncharacterized protein n=1 Tax=Nakaseomyces bracarensis TaxID=273131 RepID=A0ABR4NWD5_9SACH
MSKQFKLGVITADDISPLSKSKLPHPTVMGNDVLGEVDYPENFHDELSESIMEHNNNAFDESFKTPSDTTISHLHHRNHSINNSVASYMNLGDLPVDSSISDFWSEVKSSVDDHIDDATTITSANTHSMDDDDLKLLSRDVSAVAPYTSSDTSLEDFLNHDDLDNDIVTPAQEVKLLCLRDNKGKFTLKTTRKKAKKEKKVKKNKVIRRKSGVAAMISTGIGINEFML